MWVTPQCDVAGKHDTTWARDTSTAAIAGDERREQLVREKDSPEFKRLKWVTTRERDASLMKKPVYECQTPLRE